MKIILTDHAIRRYREQTPGADVVDIRTSLEEGEEILLELALAILQRKPPRNQTSYYRLPPDKRGIFVLTPDEDKDILIAITYLRLGEMQQKILRGRPVEEQLVKEPEPPPRPEPHPHRYGISLPYIDDETTISAVNPDEVLLRTLGMSTEKFRRYLPGAIVLEKHEDIAWRLDIGLPGEIWIVKAKKTKNYTAFLASDPKVEDAIQRRLKSREALLRHWKKRVNAELEKRYLKS